MTAKIQRPHHRVLRRISNRERCREFVLASGHRGVGMSRILRHLGLCESVVGAHLRTLLADGVIEKSHSTGRSVHWGAPGIAAAWAQKPPTEGQIRYAKRLANQSVPVPKRSRECNEEFVRESVRRIIPATQAPPLMVSAPNSVWQLAV